MKHEEKEVSEALLMYILSNTSAAQGVERDLTLPSLQVCCRWQGRHKVEMNKPDIGSF